MPQKTRPISQKAADRKTAKGKGVIAHNYPSKPGDKGQYIGYSRGASKDAPPVNRNSYLGSQLKTGKPARDIKRTGGVTKKK